MATMSELYEAIEHYYHTIYSYEGNQRDVKKADRHMDGFTDALIRAVPSPFVVEQKHRATIRGAFLNKRWDLAYGTGATFSNAIELKSIVMSKMGKCFSNRVEEAIGVATDLRHVNKDINLGYLLVVEDDFDGTDVAREKKLTKISKFCEYLEKDLKLYNNVCCIVFNSDKNYYCAYSSFEEFVSKWAKHERT
jgi:hypothetical protein